MWLRLRRPLYRGLLGRGLTGDVLVFLGSGDMTESQLGLIVCLGDTSPLPRRPGKSTMAGGSLFVKGGNLSETGVHRALLTSAQAGIRGSCHCLQALSLLL